jgi:hypothetical protein
MKLDRIQLSKNKSHATAPQWGGGPQSKELVRGPPELVQHFRL